MVIRRRFVMLGIGLASLALAFIGPAAAAATAPSPSPDATITCTTSCNFSADSGVSRVTGTITFTSATTFKLTNVTLYDTSCDNRAAEFWTSTSLADLATHVDGNGCGTHTTYSELDATASGAGNYFYYAEIVTDACNFFGCSSFKESDLFLNPYI